jgi:hypothetical protein
MTTHAKEWDVHVHVFEEEGATRAKAVLDTGENRMTGNGRARRHPADVEVPEIGDEVAVSRALNDLGHQLMAAADRDLDGVGSGPSHLADA